MNTPTTWSVVSATTICDTTNSNNNFSGDNENNKSNNKNLRSNPFVTAGTTTSVHTTTIATNNSTAAGTEPARKAVYRTSHKAGIAVNKNLPAILLDSWEVHKLAGAGSVFVNCLLAADVDNDQKDEVIIGTTEGKVIVMKCNDREPCFVHSLCATVSFIVYDAKKRELVIVTLEGQCEILRNFMVSSPEPVLPTVPKTFTSSSSSAGLSSIASQVERENSRHAQRNNRSMRHSASSPQFSVSKTYPCDCTKFKNYEQNYKSSIVERRIFFHVAANCTCGVLCTAHKKHCNNKSNNAVQVQNVMYAGSHDCRLYAYDTEQGICLLTLFAEHPITSMTHFSCPVIQNVQMPESVSAADLTHYHFWEYNIDHYGIGEVQNNIDDNSCSNVISNKYMLVTGNTHGKQMLSLLAMVIGNKVILLPSSVEEMIRCCRCDEMLVYDESKTPIYLVLQTRTQEQEEEQEYWEEKEEKEKNYKHHHHETRNSEHNTSNIANTDQKENEKCVGNQLYEGSVITASTSVLSSMSPETMVTAVAKSRSTAQTNNAQSELATHKRVKKGHHNSLPHHKGRHHHSSAWREEMELNWQDNSANCKLHVINPLCEISLTDNLVCAFSPHDVHASHLEENKPSSAENESKTKQHELEIKEKLESEHETYNPYMSRCNHINCRENSNNNNCSSSSSIGNDDVEYAEECKEEYESDIESTEHVHYAMAVEAAVHPSMCKAIIVIVREDGKMCSLSLQACQLDSNVTQEYNLEAMESDEVNEKEVVLFNEAASNKCEGNALYFYNYDERAVTSRGVANNSKSKNAISNNNSNNNANAIHAENTPLHALLQFSCNWSHSITSSHLIPRVQLLKYSHYYNKNSEKLLRSENDMVAFCLADNGEAFCVNTSHYRVIHTFVRDDSSSFVIASDYVHDENECSVNNSNNKSNNNTISDECQGESSHSAQTAIKNVPNSDVYLEHEEAEQREACEEISVNKEHHLRGLLRHFHSRSLSCFCVTINELCVYAVDELVQAAEKHNTKTLHQRKTNITSAYQSTGASSAQTTTSRPGKSTMSKAVSNMSFQSDAATELTSVSVSVTHTTNNTEVEIGNKVESEKSDDELLLELAELIQKLNLSNNNSSNNKDDGNVNSSNEQPLESAADEWERKRAIIRQTRDLLLYGFSDEEWHTMESMVNETQNVTNTHEAAKETFCLPDTKAKYDK